TAGDDRLDVFASYQAAVLVVVIRPVGVDGLWTLSGSSTPATYRWGGIDEWHEFGDVVTGAARQRHRPGDAVRIGDQMVFRARAGTVDRARSGFGPPLSARTWEPSITARDQSNAPTAFSSASNDSCSRCHTPARFHSSRRRQQVMPDPKPNC